MKGGSGAVKGADGYDHIGLLDCAGGIMAQDYEMFELQDPHRLIRHEFATDSAGGGRWRGGLGVETEFVIEGEKVTGITFGDGIEEEARAFGLFGGTKGSANRITLTYPGGTVRSPKAKEIVRGIPRGAGFFEHAGGGGGYGDPAMRPAELVVRDVKNGVVSVEAARKIYRVVIDPGTLELDGKATESLRRAEP